jgi:hypothetical protein
MLTSTTVPLSVVQQTPLTTANFEFAEISSLSMQSRLLYALLLTVSSPFFIALVAFGGVLALVAAITLIVWLRRRESAVIVWIKRLDFFKLAAVQQSSHSISFVRSVFGTLVTFFGVAFAILSLVFLVQFYYDYHPVILSNDEPVDQLPPLQVGQNTARSALFRSTGDSSSDYDQIVTALRHTSEINVTLELLDFTGSCSNKRDSVFTVRQTNCVDRSLERCGNQPLLALNQSVNEYGFSICSIHYTVPTPHTITDTTAISFSVLTSRCTFTAARVTVSTGCYWEDRCSFRKL